ncbi:MAG TPA: hypothetical protein ENI08_02115 [Candidatus Dependentiae bacterium]|nr:hypothetical protein [Candidatus Dependentiae bacterium]
MRKIFIGLCLSSLSIGQVLSMHRALTITRQFPSNQHLPSQVLRATPNGLNRGSTQHSLTPAMMQNVPVRSYCSSKFDKSSEKLTLDLLALKEKEVQLLEEHNKLKEKEIEGRNKRLDRNNNLLEALVRIEGLKKTGSGSGYNNPTATFEEGFTLARDRQCIIDLVKNNQQ